MKVVILCGGMGTRLSEETTKRPKPMVEIGGRPILWHIMKGFAQYGFCEFVLALGYKGEFIKDYFLKYPQPFEQPVGRSAIGRCRSPRRQVRQLEGPPDRYRAIDHDRRTREAGRRLHRARAVHADLRRRRLQHRLSQAARVPSQPRPSRHSDGGTSADPLRRPDDRRRCGDRAFRRSRKSARAGSTAGFSCWNHEVAEYVSGDEIIWEREPIERLAREGQLVAYRHHGFWRCMDTVRDLQLLDTMWAEGDAQWKVWS